MIQKRKDKVLSTLISLALVMGTCFPTFAFVSAANANEAPENMIEAVEASDDITTDDVIDDTVADATAEPTADTPDEEGDVEDTESTPASQPATASVVDDKPQIQTFAAARTAAVEMPTVDNRITGNVGNFSLSNPDGNMISFYDTDGGHNAYIAIYKDDEHVGDVNCLYMGGVCGADFNLDDYGFKNGDIIRLDHYDKNNQLVTYTAYVYYVSEEEEETPSILMPTADNRLTGDGNFYRVGDDSNTIGFTDMDGGHWAHIEIYKGDEHMGDVSCQYMAGECGTSVNLDNYDFKTGDIIRLAHFDENNQRVTYTAYFYYVDPHAKCLAHSNSGLCIDENGHCEIPEGVTSIGMNDFQYRSELISITIPSTVSVLATNMCIGCENLQQVKILGTINQVGARAFMGCSSLVYYDQVEGLTHAQLDALAKGAGMMNNIVTNAQNAAFPQLTERPISTTFPYTVTYIDRSDNSTVGTYEFEADSEYTIADSNTWMNDNGIYSHIPFGYTSYSYDDSRAADGVLTVYVNAKYYKDVPATAEYVCLKDGVFHQIAPKQNFTFPQEGCDTNHDDDQEQYYDYGAPYIKDIEGYEFSKYTFDPGVYIYGNEDYGVGPSGFTYYYTQKMIDWTVETDGTPTDTITLPYGDIPAEGTDFTVEERYGYTPVVEIDEDAHTVTITYISNLIDWTIRYTYPDGTESIVNSSVITGSQPELDIKPFDGYTAHTEIDELTNIITVSYTRNMVEWSIVVDGVEVNAISVPQNDIPQRDIDFTVEERPGYTAAVSIDEQGKAVRITYTQNTTTWTFITDGVEKTIEIPEGATPEQDKDFTVPSKDGYTPVVEIDEDAHTVTITYTQNTVEWTIEIDGDESIIQLPEGGKPVEGTDFTVPARDGYTPSVSIDEDSRIVTITYTKDETPEQPIPPVIPIVPGDDDVVLPPSLGDGNGDNTGGDDNTGNTGSNDKLVETGKPSVPEQNIPSNKTPEANVSAPAPAPVADTTNDVSDDVVAPQNASDASTSDNDANTTDADNDDDKVTDKADADTTIPEDDIPLTGEENDADNGIMGWVIGGTGGAVLLVGLIWFIAWRRGKWTIMSENLPDELSWSTKIKCRKDDESIEKKLEDFEIPVVPGYVVSQRFIDEDEKEVIYFYIAQ